MSAATATDGHEQSDGCVRVKPITAKTRSCVQVSRAKGVVGDCVCLAKDGSRANGFLGSSYGGVACGRTASGGVVRRRTDCSFEISTPSQLPINIPGGMCEYRVWANSGELVSFQHKKKIRRLDFENALVVCSVWATITFQDAPPVIFAHLRVLDHSGWRSG